MLDKLMVGIEMITSLIFTGIMVYSLGGALSESFAGFVLYILVSYCVFITMDGLVTLATNKLVEFTSRPRRSH